MLKRLFIILAAAAAAASTQFAVSAEQSVEGPDAEQGVVQQEKRSLADAKITTLYASYSYTGSAVTPDSRNGADHVSVRLDGTKLVKGVDYTLSYENNVRPGVAYVTATGTGDYEGSITKAFVIIPPAVSTVSLSSSNENLKVGWNAVDGADGYQIIYSKDKSFRSYYITNVSAAGGNRSANIASSAKAGEKYYVKLRPFVFNNGTRYPGPFCSARTKTIAGKVQTIGLVTGTYTYSGKEIVPSFTVRDTSGKGLIIGKDYTYTITNNISVGQAAVTVKGTGIYTGTVRKTFKIAPANISSAYISGIEAAYTFTGSAVKPEPVLTFRKAQLVKDKDYTVACSNNVNKGTATVTITGKNNFTGSVTKAFEIRGDGMVSKNGSIYYYDKNGVMQTGWQEIDGGYYCFDRITGKLVTSTTVNKVKVDSTGKAYGLTDYLKSRIETMMRAHKIMLEITSPTDTMEQKRYKCFVWEYSQHHYRRWRLIANLYKVTDEWDVDFANDIFIRNIGDCVADSCAAAYLFVEIGYTDIYVCHDTSHAWFTVNGRLFDPLFAEAKNFALNYDADFTDYRRNPVGRLRIDN